MADDQPLTDLERTLPPHLGGHFGNTNVDAPTLHYLIARYGVTTMLDVGCGPGGMLDTAKSMGLVAIGIDGDPHMATKDVITHDYTTGPLPAEHFDLVWCVEFVEHVEAEFIPNFMQTFAGGKVLFLTAAPPGFPGHHHVNCQPQSYWITLLEHHRWRLDVEATQWVRANGGHPFSTRQGLVFVRL
jgi:SAM-dependent methyltransferase